MAGTALLLILSCSKNLLNKAPLNGVSDAELWSDPGLVGTFVNERYDRIGHGWPESWMSSVTDETYMTWSRGCEPITQGYVNPSDLGRMNGGWNGWDYRGWDTTWRNIQNCNNFFAHIAGVPFNPTDSALRTRYTGEVTFIRALEYFDLVSKWGGVPIITRTYGLNSIDSGAVLPRNTYKECVDFITSECDKAAAILPASYTGSDAGRASKIAAMALKARMLLYAASPLMNKPGVDPLVGYPTPDPNRWQTVANADKALIDSATKYGYSLYQKYSDPTQNYTNLFLDKANPEILFARQNYGNTANIQYIDQANGPNGYDEWGGNTPTQEFVDAFQMKDGSAYDPNNTADSTNPYLNRDPRFYATVLVDGDMWKGRAVASHFDEDAVTPNVWHGGVDSKDGPNPWNSSKTGYNMKKFLNPGYLVDSWVFTGASAQNWNWLRLGEFYLDYAEAQYNLGNEAEAKSTTYGVNVIRARAGMPAITQSGPALWAQIVNERQIELSFEEHRYFDIRRWLIADSVGNKTATGVIVYKFKDGHTWFDAHAKDGSTITEVRKFSSPQEYWLPIPQAEINKNANLKQNPGY